MTVSRAMSFPSFSIIQRLQQDNDNLAVRQFFLEIIDSTFDIINQFVYLLSYPSLEDFLELAKVEKFIMKCSQGNCWRSL